METERCYGGRFVRYMSLHNINTWGRGDANTLDSYLLFVLSYRFASIASSHVLPKLFPKNLDYSVERSAQLLCNCRSFDGKISILQCGNMC